MRLAYMLIVLPAVFVGIGYFIVFHAMGMEIKLGPFIGAAVAIVAAVLIVRHYQKRKVGRQGGPS